MVDFVLVSSAIAAATSAVGLIDKIWDQVERVTSGSSEADIPREHRQKIQKEGDAIVSRIQGQVYFLQQSGLYLDDHYMRIRNVVGELAAAA